MDNIKSFEVKIGESLPVDYKTFLDSNTSENYKGKFFSRILPSGYKILIPIQDFYSKENFIKKNDSHLQFLIDFQEDDKLPDSYVEAKYLYRIADCDRSNVFMAMRGLHKGKIYVADSGDDGLSYQCASIDDFIESLYDFNDVKCTWEEIISAIRLGDLIGLKKLMEEQNGKLILNKDSTTDRNIFKLAVDLNRKEIVKYFLDIEFYGFDEAKKQNLISIVSSNGGSEVSKTITEPDIDSVTVTNSFGSTAENSVEITQGCEEAEEGQEAIAPAIEVLLRLFAKGGEGALTNVLIQWIMEYANPEHDYMSIADAWDGLKIDFTKVPVAVAISTFSDGGTGQLFNDVIDLLYKKLDPENDNIDISKIDIFSEGLITDSFFKEADVWLNGGGTDDITFPNQPNLNGLKGPVKEGLLCINLSEKCMNVLNGDVGRRSAFFDYINESKSELWNKIEPWKAFVDAEEPC